MRGLEVEGEGCEACCEGAGWDWSQLGPKCGIEVVTWWFLCDKGGRGYPGLGSLEVGSWRLMVGAPWRWHSSG